MEVTRERPDVQKDRILVATLLAASAGMAVWLVWRILHDAFANHTGEFLGLAVTVALGAYSAWLLQLYRSVTYTLDGSRLLLQLGRRALAIDLQNAVQLVRYRRRWMWTGSAQAELGVPDVEPWPPVWLATRAELWVLVFEQEGELAAIALRPSPALLATLKAWIWEHRGFAG